jgi:UDP-N-acetylmuramoylalanine--D-glutamate ligase
LQAMKNIISFIENKKIVIWGMGREGISTFNYIRSIYPDMHLTLADSKEIDMTPYPDCDFWDTGARGIDFDGFDYIFKSPGIPVFSPEKIIDRLTSQTEVFLTAFGKNTFGITGTKGKSTTSSLLYHLLKNHDDNTIFVGNIGIPCFDYIDKVDDRTSVVFEMSCHQLEFVRHSPHVGVVLNLYEEHLDHYVTMENYIKAKSHVFSCQDKEDIVILNCSDLETLSVYPRAGRLVTACDGLGENVPADISVSGNTVTVPHGSIEINSGDTCLVGKHNLYNIGVDYYICKEIFNISDDEFRTSLASFRPLAHRLERVGTFGGVTYYDDSISTICRSAINAVKSLGNVGTLILGGMDRGIDYNDLAQFLTTAEIDSIVLVGQTTERMEALFREYGVDRRIKIYPCYYFDKGVEKAKEITAEGKICLLSPAASSYDMFKNFEVRGDEFQRLVKNGNE